MDRIRGLPREQKMLAVAIAMVVFFISLFLDWVGVGDFGEHGTGLNSYWIALIFAALAAGIYATEALNIRVQGRWASIGLGAISALLVFFWAVTHFFDATEGPASPQVGAWLGLIASAVGAALAWMVWSQERA